MEALKSKYATNEMYVYIKIFDLITNTYTHTLKASTVSQLTNEMHCSRSKPNQGHIKRQHSVKKNSKSFTF